MLLVLQTCPYRHAQRTGVAPIKSFRQRYAERILLRKRHEHFSPSKCLQECPMPAVHNQNGYQAAQRTCDSEALIHGLPKVAACYHALLSGLSGKG